MFKKICYFLLISGFFIPSLLNAQELAIPRFVSFRKSETNMRTGPGDRYPIKYVYHAQNYPVEVIDEYELWRQVREVDGTIGWINRRMLSGVRYVIVTADTSLYKKPDNKSPQLAYIQKNSLAKLEECPAQSDYCQVLFIYEGKKYEGWLNKNSFYGVYPHEVIR